MSRTKCKICGKKLDIVYYYGKDKRCEDCHNVDMRLDKYLENKRGMERVLEAIDKKNNFVSCRYIEVSTRHVQPKDMGLLFRAPDVDYSHNPLISYYYPGGAFLVVPPDELNKERKIELIEHGYSKLLVDLLIFAQKHELQLVRLDADGDNYPSLGEGVWE